MRCTVIIELTDFPSAVDGRKLVEEPKYEFRLGLDEENDTALV